MCKYCDSYVSGDFDVDLFEDEMDCGFLGRIVFAGNIIKDQRNNPAVKCSLFTIPSVDGKEVSNTIAIETNPVPINYCPMCGKDLRKL